MAHRAASECVITKNVSHQKFAWEGVKILRIRAVPWMRIVADLLLLAGMLLVSWRLLAPK